jgi:cytochrome c-type biogenesis protein CcmH
MTQGFQASSGPRYMLWAAALVFVLSAGYALLRSLKKDPPTEEQALPASSPDAVIASLEARTTKNPQDTEAWQLLGWSYFELGRHGEAAMAYRKATALAPERAVYWSSLGEALVMASEHDPMPTEAAAAFTKAIALDPKEPRARYFNAVRKDLADDHAGAIADWIALFMDTPTGAPWEADLRRTIEQVGKINTISVKKLLAAADADRAKQSPSVTSVAASPIPGPSKDQMMAAAKLPSGQQQIMVETMVAGLEAKLAKNPVNSKGWIMLMRSRVTLGEAGKAKAAFDKAIATNPNEKAYIISEATQLGILRD